MIERSFGTLFLLGGLLLLAVAVSTGVQQWRGNVVYEPVPGVVEAVEVREFVVRSRRGERQEYRPVVRYRYEIDQTIHQSTQFAAHETNYARATADAYASAFTPGQSVTVYVDPEDPTRAIIHRQWQFLPYGLGIMGLIVTNVGVLLCIAINVRARRGEPCERGFALSPERPIRGERRGAIAVVGLTLLSGAGVTHYYSVQSPTIMALALTGVFVVVAGASCWAAMRVIRVSNVIGDPQIVLTNPVLRVGQSEKVRIELPVAMRQPVELATITLACVDVVIVGAGKNRAEQRTDRHAIVHTIAEQTEGKSMPIETSARFNIPADLPPSTPRSQRGHPRIVWELRVAATLTARPTYRGVYPVIVERAVDAAGAMVDDSRALG